MSDLFNSLTNKAQRANASAYYPFIQAEAAKHGVNPSFVLGLSLSESNGNPKALGDVNKAGVPVAHGLYQVQTRNMGTWGFDSADGRLDPKIATAKITPALRKLLDNSNNDWGIAHVGFVSGPNSKYVRRLKAGMPPDQAFADLPEKYAHVRKRYETGRAQQIAFGAVPSPPVKPTVAPNVAPPQYAPMPAAASLPAHLFEPDFSPGVESIPSLGLHYVPVASNEVDYGDGVPADTGAEDIAGLYQMLGIG